MGDTESVKELIAAATKELKTKNSELLGKLKEAKTTLTKFSNIDVDQLIKDSKNLQKLTKDKDKEKGEYKKLYEQQQEQHATELTKLKKELEESINTTLSLKKSTALKGELVKNHIDPILLEAAESVLLPTIAVDEEGKILVGDKSLDSFVEEWATTDVGKRFVSSGNSGGGANGPGESGTPESDYFNPKSDNYNITKQAKIANNNPELYKTLKKKFA